MTDERAVTADLWAAAALRRFVALLSGASQRAGPECDERPPKRPPA